MELLLSRPSIGRDKLTLLVAGGGGSGGGGGGGDPAYGPARGMV